jgi:hypothetical protein
MFKALLGASDPVQGAFGFWRWDFSGAWGLELAACVLAGGGIR